MSQSEKTVFIKKREKQSGMILRYADMTLKELEIGKTAIIKSVGGCGALRQHFLDMGVIPGAKVVVNKYAPMGDPMELTVQGYKLTLRLADADLIEVEKEDQTISEIE